MVERFTDALAKFNRDVRDKAADYIEQGLYTPDKALDAAVAYVLKQRRLKAAMLATQLGNVISFQPPKLLPPPRS